MNRRELLAGVGAGALVGTATRAYQSADTYRNPVYDHVFPDPDVLRVESTYYAYGTYHQWASGPVERQLVPVLRSSNLVDWEPVGPAFEAAPPWSRYRGLWAPGVGRRGGRTLLYYSDAEFGAENPGVGVATAPDPTGPFEPRGGLFRSEPVGVPNSIDPMLFEGGHPYLFWGSHRGSYGVRLADDGLSTAGEKFQIAGEGVEAPYVVERDGCFYFFGSRGTCCAGAESTYHVVTGRAEQLRGPYRNRDGERLTADGATGTTILQSSETFRAPGHCAVVCDAQGGWWLLYHAYVAGKAWVGDTPRRVLMLDRLRWRDGWPVVGEDGTPSRVGKVPPASHSYSA
ncbi:family 43 glycosylhydrolase [Haloarcula sp. S1CR25-12]|uniref:Family 43 glycosylhydrolase n=1 Tax=Haloarcula saliterrae TaxID=2950534 RepID=A0ABU2FEA9_9EURY|nr:family 43 glycosylhydrolase [Haloarcula sp. S1CR25-12]MDS0260283.1 family 43 glycosylhydrolase [Haloarcula sp. S1CR25-12]